MHITSDTKDDSDTTPNVLSGKRTPEDKPQTLIRHSRLGVWDYYEEEELYRPRLATTPLVNRCRELSQCIPYVMRMIVDVLNIPGCAVLTAGYSATQVGSALMPALSIWCEGHLLQITQVALETRTVDTRHLLFIFIARTICTILAWALHRTKRRIELPLNTRIRRWWALHAFRAHARLDAVTFSQSATQRALRDVSVDEYRGSNVIWESLELVIDLVSATVQLGAQVVVLLQVLRGQTDGALLAVTTLALEVLYWVNQMDIMKSVRVWVATTTHAGYLRMQGWKGVVRAEWYRKEFVAGNLADYATSEFQRAAEDVGDHDGSLDEWQSRLEPRYGPWSCVQESLKQLPQVLFTFRAAASPTTIPTSLASLHLVQDAAHKFGRKAYDMIHRARWIESQLLIIKRVYEVAHIPNVVRDGNVPFPEDAAQIRHGISLEFRNVSFKYPGNEEYALRNVSFTLLPGQLCVIVGPNGSGKSTVLKLAARLDDPEDGQILLGGHDIRTLRLSDVRRAVSVLFQDFSLFPLSIRDNIAIGDPSTAHDDERIQHAARLAGAEDFVRKLPEGFDTYLDKPVADEYASVQEGTRTLTGRVVDFGPLREAARIRTARNGPSLSGGQMQRIAVARTFMRSVLEGEEAKVGLLLFDEPSAALDPAAEYDLFDRLRELRGSKTMVFSTHRFGNLTRHADVILYIDGSTLHESGTHEELLKKDGEYAKLWKLQAEAFVN